MYYNNIEFNDFVQVHRVKVWLKKVSKMTANVQEFFRAITKIKTKQILISTLISLLWKKTINFTIF